MMLFLRYDAKGALLADLGMSLNYNPGQKPDTEVNVAMGRIIFRCVCDFFFLIRAPGKSRLLIFAMFGCGIILIGQI